jgi:hypothetical protein
VLLVTASPAWPCSSDGWRPVLVPRTATEPTHPAGLGGPRRGCGHLRIRPIRFLPSIVVEFRRFRHSGRVAPPIQYLPPVEWEQQHRHDQPLPSTLAASHDVQPPGGSPHGPAAGRSAGRYRQAGGVGSSCSQKVSPSHCSYLCRGHPRARTKLWKQAEEVSTHSSSMAVSRSRPDRVPVWAVAGPGR